MTESIAQIIVILLLILLTAYFAASEYAIIAVRKSRIDELAKKGDTMAKLIQHALDRREDYIFTTQIGTTITSLLLGWIGQPFIAKLLLSLFTFIPHEQSLVVVNALALIIGLIVLTVIVTIFGELLPKTFTLYHTEVVSYAIITPLVFLVKIVQPFVGILNKVNTYVLRLFGVTANSHKATGYSKEEVGLILEQLQQSGEIKKGGVDMLRSVFSLSDKPIKSIMTPRTEITAIEVNATLSTVLHHVNKSYSRYPVYKKSLDNLIGFIHTKDVYRKLALGMKDNTRLSKMSIIRAVINIPETKRIDKVLLDMRKKHVHLAAVYDEFGSMVGIVTLEDIIETLVGDIQDEFDIPVKGIRRNPEGSYMIDGNISAQLIQKRFHLPLKGHGYRTIGGMIFGLLGREPHVGDQLEIGHLVFEVITTQGKRIKRLRLKRQSNR